jgi:hypothetical protein
MGGAAAMVLQAELEARKQRAVQMILESGIVTPALDHDEAGLLLDWALAAVAEYALSTGDMGDKEANTHIRRGVKKVRRLMEMVNDVMVQWDDANREQMVRKLLQLLSAAKEGVSQTRD